MTDPVVTTPPAAAPMPSALGGPGAVPPTVVPGTQTVDPATGGTPTAAAPAVDLKPEGAKPEDKPAEPVAFDPAKLTLPEGMKTDDPLFQEYTALVADDKLSAQERGQKLLSVYEKGVKAVSEANTKAWETLQEGWVKTVKADPDIGGAKFETTKATIAKAIDTLGPAQAAEFRQALDVTGAGNHPAIWKGLAKLAASLTEPGHVTGQPPAGAKPSVKEAFYPNSPDMK